MSNEKAIRIEDGSGLQLLKGQIRNVHQVWPGKILFDVGKFTCKAFGKAADEFKKLGGQTVEMFGEWEKLRKDPNVEEFIAKGRYKGIAFEASASTTVRTSTSNSQSGPVAAQLSSDPAPSKSPGQLGAATAPNSDNVEAKLTENQRRHYHLFKRFASRMDWEIIRDTSTNEDAIVVAKLLLGDASKKIITPQPEAEAQV